MECLTGLVGIKELCESGDSTPLFYIDDAEGLDRTALAQLTKPSNGSGLIWGKEIIESASRFLMADIETLVPKGYSIKSSINSFCNTCTYTSVYSASANTGIIVKNISSSNNGFLSINSLKVLLGSTGDYTIVIDDGILPKAIPGTFSAGVEKIFTGINYKTSALSVKIYISEAGTLVNALNCPITKSCGCSGSNKQSKDISITGLLNGSEFSTQYGFVPCASIVCSMDNILCSIVNQQPKLFALALFYRTVAKIWAEVPVTQRNNVVASYSTEEKSALSDLYMNLYYERLRGSTNVKGISDNMAAVFNNLKDDCIHCDRVTVTAWAIG